MGKEKNLEALDWGEAECREKIHEILDIVLDINSLGKREKKLYREPPYSIFLLLWSCGQFRNINT